MKFAPGSNRSLNGGNVAHRRREEDYVRLRAAGVNPDTASATLALSPTAAENFERFYRLQSGSLGQRREDAEPTPDHEHHVSACLAQGGFLRLSEGVRGVALPLLDLHGRACGRDGELIRATERRARA